MYIFQNTIVGSLFFNFKDFILFLNQHTAEVRIWGVIIYLEDLGKSSQVS